MGRGGRGWKKGRGSRGQGSGGQDGSYTSYPEIEKTNQALEIYYNTLLALSEDEQKIFWDTLKRDLPNSFRFCGSKGHALAVRRLLQDRYIPEIVKIDMFDDKKVEPPAPVPWYPDNLAWSMTTTKNVVRKHPPFKAFKEFLVSETSVGNISRQEVVSMIPPLLMDLRPGMAVLDMCAAPGSKAAQLLEMIHAGEEARIHKVMRGEGDDSILEADPSDDGRATGLFIANDADYKRSQMLIHQLKRLSSPNMLVTNHDASQYPSIKLPRQEGDAPNRTRYLKFDRILADVPCSGDGTLRKNIAIWKDWNPNNALGLHPIQSRILVRALQMLKVGGRVVYSTCSMNPVENEAVVASAIERCGGLEKIEIVDCSNELPALVRRPGMQKWSLMDRTGRFWHSWKDVKDAEQKGELTSHKFTETMFPREDSNLPLERCMRVYSHLQDTGGFFITVLQKKADIKAKPENESRQGVAKEARAAPANGTKKTSTTEAEPPKEETSVHAASPTANKHSLEDETVEQDLRSKRQRTDEDVSADGPIEAKTESLVEAKPPVRAMNKPKRPNGPHEEPFKYLPGDHEVLKNIRQFYDISDRFPKDRFMVRNAASEPAKAIYYSSALVRDVLVENEGRGFKFVHGGVKMFVKQDAPSAEVCRWRIQSDGLPILEGYVGENRVIYLRHKETLHGLLLEMFPIFKNDEWQKLGEIGERIRDIGMGCCVLRVEPTGEDEAFTERMALPLWKSIHSLNLMLPKEDRKAMLLRIYNDTTPVINKALKTKYTEAQAEGESNNDVVDAENAPSTAQI